MEEKKTGGLAQFRRMGDLSMRKLREYIPAMLMTNLSTLLLVTVDGVVAGNLVGKDALASINIFAPVSILVGSLSMLVSSGISISISTAMGKNDPEELDRVKGVSLRVMILTAAAASVLQIPLVWMILTSYGLSPEMFAMTMQYAVGIMICIGRIDPV
jgi:Na+-driven multidrug efflux pump